MELTDNLLRRIKNRLNAKFHVMNDTWLRDCVEFFITQNIPRKVTDNDILTFVESQWQLSDLREINNENGCLPRNLEQQVHTKLPGTYILQVDKMYDIASSKYKQLSEIRKTSNANVEVTEKETSEEKTEWEPKAKRMLQLYLTDGVQDITAIEYTTVKQIRNGMLLPGSKVMIIGPVDCRRGIILLEDSNFKEVGGEVESLFKLNALENVLARALEEPENPDPYNELSKASNQNSHQNATSSLSPTDDSFFDDDFEQAVDLEAVTALERSQEIIEIQDSFESPRDRRQITEGERNETIDESLEDINFEPLEDWPSDPPTRSLRALPTSRIEFEGFDEENSIIIVEEASTSACESRSKPLPSANSLRNESASKFPDDNSAVKKHISTEAAVTQHKKSMASTSEIQQIPKTKVIPDVFRPPPKICDVLSDVLRESVTGKIYRTVRGQVKDHSTLTKEGKCWVLMALIADHTASLKVCFDSEVLEKFLGFTVQEFSQKKKLAKSNPQINDELRLSLRRAQHQIQNLDALLKLELVQDQTAKVVDITQLTPDQKEALKKPL